jgi:hypothetical protein
MIFERTPIASSEKNNRLKPSQMVEQSGQKVELVCDDAFPSRPAPDDQQR